LVVSRSGFYDECNKRILTDPLHNEKRNETANVDNGQTKKRRDRDVDNITDVELSVGLAVQCLPIDDNPADYEV